MDPHHPDAEWGARRYERAVDDIRRAGKSAGQRADLAEHLVRGGLPFREAHAVVGRLVRRHLDEGEDLEALVVAEPGLGPDAARYLQAGYSVTQRTTRGGAGPAPVSEQLERARAHVAALASRVDEL